MVPIDHTENLMTIWCTFISTPTICQVLRNKFQYPSAKGFPNCYQMEKPLTTIRTYSDALKRFGFQEKPALIPKTPSDPRANERCKHRRKIIWFNLPYSMNVKTNIGKVFLNL